MKIPYVTEILTRKYAKKYGCNNRAIAVYCLGILLYELPYLRG